MYVRLLDNFQSLCHDVQLLIDAQEAYWCASVYQDLEYGREKHDSHHLESTGDLDRMYIEPLKQYNCPIAVHIVSKAP